MSHGKILAAPFINLLLVKSLGISKDIANYTTMTGVVALDLWTNPLTPAKIITVGTVATLSIATSLMTHFCYRKSCALGKENSREVKELEGIPGKSFTL